MRILGIETALGFSEVALLDERNGSSPETLMDPAPYSENVVRLARTLLSTARKSVSELDAIAVSIGPGSFTGLRIGLSVAKGLAVSLNRPLVSVSTLDALAASVIYSRTVEGGCDFLAVIDAKRGEYYSAAYMNENGNPVLRSGPRVAAASDILNDAEQGSGTIVLGTGGGRLEEEWKNSRLPRSARLRILERSNAISPAAAVAILGLRRFQHGDFENVASLEPFYMKDFIIHTQS